MLYIVDPQISIGQAEGEGDVMAETGRQWDVILANTCIYWGYTFMLYIWSNISKICNVILVKTCIYWWYYDIYAEGLSIRFSLKVIGWAWISLSPTIVRNSEIWWEPRFSHEGCYALWAGKFVEHPGAKHITHTFRPLPNIVATFWEPFQNY